MTRPLILIEVTKFVTARIRDSGNTCRIIATTVSAVVDAAMIIDFSEHVVSAVDFEHVDDWLDCERPTRTTMIHLLDGGTIEHVVETPNAIRRKIFDAPTKSA
jgi:hypothetical protein